MMYHLRLVLACVFVMSAASLDAAQKAVSQHEHTESEKKKSAALVVAEKYGWDNPFSEDDQYATYNFFYGPQRVQDLIKLIGEYAEPEVNNQWELHGSLKGHTLTITSLQFHDEQRPLTSKSWDGSVKKWDLFTGRVVCTFTPIVVKQTITYPGQDGAPDEVEVFEEEYAPNVGTVDPHTPKLTSVQVPNNVFLEKRWAQTYTYKCDVTITEPNGTISGTINNHSPVSALEFDVSGDMLAVGYWHGQIDIWRKKVSLNALLRECLPTK